MLSLNVHFICLAGKRFVLISFDSSIRPNELARQMPIFTLLALVFEVKQSIGQTRKVEGRWFEPSCCFWHTSVAKGHIEVKLFFVNVCSQLYEKNYAKKFNSLLLLCGSLPSINKQQR